MPGQLPRQAWPSSESVPVSAGCWASGGAEEGEERDGGGEGVGGGEGDKAGLLEKGESAAMLSRESSMADVKRGEWTQELRWQVDL